MKIPIFDAYLSDDEYEGISCISIVDEPAMEKAMLVFNKDKKPILFQVQDEMQHKITSVVIRCNYPIYRINERGEEYYIRFGKEVIDQLAEKYSRDGLLNRVSVMHNGELLNDIVMTEMYIKDIDKGINPVGFEDIENYSLMATFKINNEDVWNRIMAGEFGGLSMEVMLDVQPTDEYVEDEDDFWTEFIKWLCTHDEEYVKKKFKVEKITSKSANVLTLMMRDIPFYMFDYTICNCKKVTYNDIVEALHSMESFDDVLKTFETVQSITNCSTGCGGCHQKVLDIISEIMMGK